MPLNYTELQKYLSASRLQNYELISDGNNRKSLKLYHTNLRLSQAFYPLLSLLEIILRNALNEGITIHFTDPNWLTAQQTGFMNDPSLSYRNSTGRLVHNHYLQNTVAKSIAGGASTQGKIIADVSFGFWTALFDTTHYRLLAGCPIRIFSNLPLNSTRSAIHIKLKKLNNFRNKVYHNEAIIFGEDLLGNTIFSLTDAKEIYKEIQEFFIWLNLDFNEWTKGINNINFEIERAECVIKSFPLKKYYYNRIIIGIKHYQRKYANN